MHTLTVSGICKQFRRNKPVLTDVSFSANGGECIGIIGENGSGKSTLLSIIAGCLKRDAGEIVFDGNSLGKGDFAKSIAYVPQDNPLIEELSVRDNLRLWYGNDLSTIMDGGDDLTGILGIHEFIDEKVKHLSGGMKKRLSIGLAASERQPVILLDEPGAALDLPCKERIGVYLNARKSRGHIIVIATHEEREIALCDRILLLKNGDLNQIDYDGDIHRLVGMLNAG
ncbi:MAG: ABC transporter ATP-binding protein [Eubacterium sp.]|nr:ABC transporter ATP-binding protein [Eubacterium sp.]